MKRMIFQLRCLRFGSLWVLLFGVLFIVCTTSVKAQSEHGDFEFLDSEYGGKYFLRTQGIFSPSLFSPSFLRRGQYGRYSISPHAFYYGVGLGYAQSLGVFQNLDLKLSSGLSLNSDHLNKTYIESGFVALGYGHLQLLLGKKIQEEGALAKGQESASSNLSLGDLLFSPNSRPMPQLSLALRQYTAVPFTASILAVRGGIRHLWMGDNYGVKDSYMLHAYGGVELRALTVFSMDYEVHHAAQWGGTSDKYGALGDSFSDCYNAFLGKSGGPIYSENVNAQGNHMVMQLMRLNFLHHGSSLSWVLSSYWEQMAEDGPVRFMTSAMNLPDGLFGLSLNFFADSYQFTLLYEYLCTSDQSGPWHDKDGLVFGGNDNYYNNAIYTYGWSYKGRGLGNPLILSPLEYLALHDRGAKALSQDSRYANVFFLNRVQAQHVALDFRAHDFRTNLSYTSSLNYGSYDLDQELNLHEYALGLRCSYIMPYCKAWRYSMALAFDWGNLLGQNQGISLGVSYLGKLF